jgi:hypothetical protein
MVSGIVAVERTAFSSVPARSAFSPGRCFRCGSSVCLHVSCSTVCFPDDVVVCSATFRVIGCRDDLVPERLQEPLVRLHDLLLWFGSAGSAHNMRRCQKLWRLRRGPVLLREPAGGQLSRRNRQPRQWRDLLECALSCRFRDHGRPFGNCRSVGHLDEQ